MKSVWFFNFIALCVIYTGVKSDTADYDAYNFFYWELGCVKNKNTPAQGFDCPEFPSKNGSCRFSNHYVQLGDKIDQDLLKGSCIPECTCNEDGFFTCPGTDCGIVAKKGCHNRHSLDSCCPGEPICGDDIAKCEIEGHIYKEGEKVYLKESCEVCVCDKGFKKEAPFCKPVRCNLEVVRSQELADRDAPVYLKGDKCCPTTWIKNEGEDEIETFISDVSKGACKFGEKEISIGDGFHRTISRFGTEHKLRCECYSPPYLICKEI